jgi:hypothetical protein
VCPSNADGGQQEKPDVQTEDSPDRRRHRRRFSIAAQAFETRIGNGSSWVTINPTTSVQARQKLTQAPNLPLSRYGNGHN